MPIRPPVNRQTVPEGLPGPPGKGGEVGGIEEHHVETAEPREEVGPGQGDGQAPLPGRPLERPQRIGVDVRCEHSTAGSGSFEGGESGAAPHFDHAFAGVDHGRSGKEQAVLPGRVDPGVCWQEEVDGFHGLAKVGKDDDLSPVNDGMAEPAASPPSSAPAPGVPGEREAQLHREGTSDFFLPPGPLRPERRGPAHRAAVFYNPAMSFTRDLDVAVLRAVALERGRRLRVWEALAASGIRSVRWLNETEALSDLVATELNPEALSYLRRNLRPWERAHVLSQDARKPEIPERFDWVDLDPYGTPVPFLPAAVKRLEPGGILSVTATDTAVLAGPERKSCLERYGARPLRTYLCREAGLRILLAHVSSVAGREERGIHPLLCYGRDHHFRIYVQLVAPGEKPPIHEVPFPGYTGPPIPEGRRGGPLWTGPLFDPGFLRRMEVPGSAEQGPAVGVWLELLREESAVDRLFYYEVGEVCKSLGLARPPRRDRIFSSLRAAGWTAARTHLDPAGFRTDAPWAAVAERISELSAAG